MMNWIQAFFDVETNRLDLRFLFQQVSYALLAATLVGGGRYLGRNTLTLAPDTVIEVVGPELVFWVGCLLVVLVLLQTAVAVLISWKTASSPIAWLQGVVLFLLVVPFLVTIATLANYVAANHGSC